MKEALKGRPAGRAVAFLVTMALGVLGCRRAPAPAAVEPEIVATYRGGSVTLLSVERTLRYGPPPGPDEAAVVAAYRRVAEDAVVRATILSRIADVDDAVAALGADRGRLLREETVEAWLRREVGDRVEVPAAEVAAYYEANPARFETRPRRFAWHLFKRHEDPARPDRTRRTVEELRTRASHGETFAGLAKKYSDSETRAFGGQLGWLEKGRLPAPLDAALFALRPGETSAPLAVAGGFVLLHVSDVSDGRRLALDDVRSGIAATLATERRRRAVARALEGEERPPGSLILEAEAVVGRLQASRDDDVVLEVGGERITAGVFRAMAAEAPVDPLPFGDGEERLRTLYADVADRLRLYLRLRRIGFPPQGPETEGLREGLRRRAEDLLVGKALEDRMLRRVEAEGKELARFFEDNRFLYQSPLRMRLRALSVPLRGAPAETSLELARVRERLAAGKASLVDAARETGGVVEEIGWAGPAELSAMSPKVRSYLLDLNGPGFTVPFQLDRKLWILQVRERDEPRPIPFEQAAPSVRRDFLERHKQRIYREAVEEVLQEARFDFRESAVRRAPRGEAP